MQGSWVGGGALFRKLLPERRLRYSVSQADGMPSAWIELRALNLDLLQIVASRECAKALQAVDMEEPGGGRVVGRRDPLRAVESHELPADERCECSAARGTAEFVQLLYGGGLVVRQH